MRRLNKAGKGEAVTFWGIGIVAVLAILLVTGMWKPVIPGFSLGSVGGTGTAPPVGDNCGSTKATTLTFSVKNVQNTSGDETFDTAYKFIGSSGSVVSGTDSTAGSVTLNCGETYTIKGLSASGASGDSAKYYSVTSGIAQINPDGTATFKATVPAQSLILGGKQHGVLEARAFDVLQNNFMYTEGDTSATDYDVDGTKFNSTTSGEEGTTVGSGGEYHIKVYYRPTVDDNVYGDIAGYLVMVDASTTVWNVPTVKINGATYSDVKASLNPDEAKAFNSFEYVYIISDEVKQTAEATLDFDIFALSGVNPGASDDIAIDFASRGAYASTTNSDLVKVGAVKDDSAQTVVHQHEDFDFAMA